MASLTPPSFPHLHNIFSNLPAHKRYIVTCLIFSLPANSTPSSITSHLTSALSTLASSFPFLAGRVAFSAGSKGAVANVVPHEAAITLLTSDMQSDPKVPSLSDLTASNFPFRLLSPDVFAPVADGAYPPPSSPAPVLILQANYVSGGGLLLTVCGNHVVMDMTGLGSIIALLAKACRGDSFSPSEVRAGNQDRRSLPGTLGAGYHPGSETEDFTVVPQDQKSSEVDEGVREKNLWAYFWFSAERLKRLKEEANEQDQVDFVSTDDALCALCWQRITYARLDRLREGMKTTLARVISVRRQLGLEGYLGHMADVAYETEIDIYRQPLGEVAAKLRLHLRREEEIVLHVRAYATMIERVEDKSSITPGAKLDIARDLVVSSYANTRLCELEFGVLGRATVARSLRSEPSPCVTIMPKSEDGGMAVGVCLAEGDMERLKADDGWSRYAQYVG